MWLLYGVSHGHSVNITLLGDNKLEGTVKICKQVDEVNHNEYYDYIKSCVIRLVVITLNNKLAVSDDKFPNSSMNLTLATHFTLP